MDTGRSWKQQDKMVAVFEEIHKVLCTIDTTTEPFDLDVSSRRMFLSMQMMLLHVLALVTGPMTQPFSKQESAQSLVVKPDDAAYHQSSPRCPGKAHNG